MAAMAISSAPIKASSRRPEKSALMMVTNRSAGYKNQ
jgi:hypothetical protein